MPHMPVRVFTYLVGKDKSNAAELFWMACSNKGKALYAILSILNLPIGSYGSADLKLHARI